MGDQLKRSQRQRKAAINTNSEDKVKFKALMILAVRDGSSYKLVLPQNDVVFKSQSFLTVELIES